MQLEGIVGGGVRTLGISTRIDESGPDIREVVAEATLGAGMYAGLLETELELTLGETRPGLASDLPLRGGLLSGGGEFGVVCREQQVVNAITAVLLVPLMPGPVFRGEAGLRYCHVTEGGASLSPDARLW